IWHYLRANRMMVSVRTRDSLDELKSETIHLIDSIVAAAARSDFPPHESQLCDWCEFYSICPAKRHPYATATLGPEEFSTDRGVQLADQYVAAARAKTQAEDVLVRARQEVLDFAKANNLTRLQGHGATVGITRRTELALPNQDDPNRTILESLVRASGQWEKVSELSRSKLPKAIQGDLFDPNTRGQIASLLTSHPIEIVRERKLAREEFDDGPDV
ncbi:MAG: hypothetical protein HY304_09690, partial [candidate division Zixibacteria bacterium]|nr:hypothetical protein [candidate division Zixibacteria bacterium]